MIDVDDLDDPNEQRRDFRRANGAPLVSDPNDPDKTLRYSRPSSYGKNLDDENALVNWRLWKAMDGVARSTALQTQIVAAREDDREEKGRLRELALDKGKANERADMGTGLHAMTARVEDTSDVDFDPPEQYQPDLAAYSDLLDRYGLVSEMVEVHIVNDAYRAAGTADRIYRLTRPLVAPDGRTLDIGTLVLGDLKTGAKLDFSLPAYCVQLALYAGGTLYDIELERRLATPPIDQNWALLVHVPFGSGRATLLWCSVATGNYGAWLSLEIKEWQRRWKRGDTEGKDYQFCDAVTVDDPLELPATVTQRLEEGGIAVAETTAVPMEQMIEYCRLRVATIGSNDQAKRWLLLNWPEGLPSPKQGDHTPEQMVQLLNLLDDVEKRFSIPFLHPDPRLPLQAGLAKGEIDRSNEFAIVT